MRRVPREQLQIEAPRSEPPEARPRPESPPRHSTKRTHRPSAADLLETPGALMTRSHLRQLGLERRAIDAVFRTLPVVALPGYSRPMIRAAEYHELVDAYTYRDNRVRPRHA
jgi:hypothetical protein